MKQWSTRTPAGHRRLAGGSVPANPHQPLDRLKARSWRAATAVRRARCAARDLAADPEWSEPEHRLRVVDGRFVDEVVPPTPHPMARGYLALAKSVAADLTALRCFALADERQPAALACPGPRRPSQSSQDDTSPPDALRHVETVIAAPNAPGAGAARPLR